MTAQTAPWIATPEKRQNVRFSQHLGLACPCCWPTASPHGSAESDASRRQPFSAVFSTSRPCKPEVTGSIPVRSMAQPSRLSRNYEGPETLIGPFLSDLVRFDREQAGKCSAELACDVITTSRLLELVRIYVERDRRASVTELPRRSNCPRCGGVRIAPRPLLRRGRLSAAPGLESSSTKRTARDLDAHRRMVEAWRLTSRRGVHLTGGRAPSPLARMRGLDAGDPPHARTREGDPRAHARTRVKGVEGYPPPRTCSSVGAWSRGRRRAARPDPSRARARTRNRRGVEGLPTPANVLAGAGPGCGSSRGTTLRITKGNDGTSSRRQACGSGGESDRPHEVRLTVAF